MSTCSVAGAKNQLSQLIGCALHGEAVLITRRGRPVPEMRPADAALRPITDADLDWLAARRATSPVPPNDGATLVRALRDEWER